MARRTAKELQQAREALSEKFSELVQRNELPWRIEAIVGTTSRDGMLIKQTEMIVRNADRTTNGHLQRVKTALQAALARVGIRIRTNKGLSVQQNIYKVAEDNVSIEVIVMTVTCPGYKTVRYSITDV